MAHTDTKRRCAGCNRVITGRPNKLYCSDQCRWRMAKTAEKSSAVSSVIRGSNGKLIATVARLGYLGPRSGPVLDLTYGRGSWWTLYRPDALIIGEGDFTNRPEADGAVPTICFDPPYISTGSKAKSSVPDFYARYGLGELSGWRAVRKVMDAGLAECARVLMPHGFLLVKCMDYVESRRKVWNTFHMAAEGEALELRLLDRFVHVTGGGPQPEDNLDGTPRDQKHAREVYSMLLVFTK